jgi:hypothetical protein
VWLLLPVSDTLFTCDTLIFKTEDTQQYQLKHSPHNQFYSNLGQMPLKTNKFIMTKLVMTGYLTFNHIVLSILYCLTLLSYVGGLFYIFE